MDDGQQGNGQVAIERTKALGAARILGQLLRIKRAVSDIQRGENRVAFFVANGGGDPAGDAVLLAAGGEHIADGGW